VSIATHPAALWRQTETAITAGKYDACLLDYRTAIYFFGRAPKVILLWRIVTMGSAFGVVLPGYYAVRELKGKAQRRGRFQIGKRSALARDMSRMLNAVPPMDHVPLEDLDAIYRVKVDTVMRDSRQQPLVEGMQYSKVTAVEGLIE